MAHKVTAEEQERLQRIVRKNLRGDEVILRARLYEMVKRGDYWELVYVIAWQSESRRERLPVNLRGNDSGTHRVHYNSKGEEALFIGHYDMTTDEALADVTERMKHAPMQSR